MVAFEQFQRVNTAQTDPVRCNEVVVYSVAKVEFPDLVRAALSSQLKFHGTEIPTYPALVIPQYCSIGDVAGIDEDSDEQVELRLCQEIHNHLNPRAYALNRRLIRMYFSV